MRDFLPDWTVPKSSAQEANVSSSLTPMPQIKPLVWIGEGSSLVFATTAIGDFKCQFFKHASQWSVASNNWAAFHTCWFDSLEEAKAACEQEYERRVRECLE